MLARGISATALVIAVVAIAAVLLDQSSYMVDAHFADASELVAGGSVEVAGIPVGSIQSIGVTPDGEADVVLAIDDQRFVPLHAGTRATIRALSQTGVANHYVELMPGPMDAPVLHTGTVLPVTATTSMVGLDAILDAFGPRQRSSLQQLIGSSDQIYAGSGARYFNGALIRLAPASAELAGLSGQLAADRGEITQIIAAGSTAAGAIASRGAALTDAVANTATTLEALALRRRALADLIARAPAVFAQTRTTLAATATAVRALRPTLAEVPAAAGPLTGLLARLHSTLPPTAGVADQLRTELPSLQQTLAGLPPLQQPAVTALHSAARALKLARPIVRDVRFYGVDLLLGVFLGLAGTAPANYDRWGHYARIEFTEPYQTLLGGPLSPLLSKPLAPSLFDLRTRLLRRCPGGNTAPAPDGSNPWIPDRSICTPSQDVPLSVDFP